MELEGTGLSARVECLNVMPEICLPCCSPRDEALTRYVAGHETTATAFSWTWYLPATSPHTVRGEQFPLETIFVGGPYVTQRSPAHWLAPGKFDPERFRPEAREAHHRFANFPFGGGPRVCIGERFAWLEGVLVLAAVARHWRFRVDSAYRPEPVPLPRSGSSFGALVFQ